MFCYLLEYFDQPLIKYLLVRTDEQGGNTWSNIARSDRVYLLLVFLQRTDIFILT